jgi:type IV secretory pathway TraG/TraD family ATPase VirD4
MNPQQDDSILWCVPFIVGFFFIYRVFETLSPFKKYLALVGLVLLIGSVLTAIWFLFSASQKERRANKEIIKDIPAELLVQDLNSITVGFEADLKIPIYIPDSIRTRHVHILGATGSGKTESVILNFLKQDVSRGLGAIILDAKGDQSFESALRSMVPEAKLKIFDLGSEESDGYNPLSAGSALESAQRLFSSLVWSEEYYRSRAFNSLQLLFQSHFRQFKTNPTLNDLAGYLANAKTFAARIANDSHPEKQAEKDFEDLGGLRDQIATLTMGHLASILSPAQSLDLEDASRGTVIYFRLQSLMSPQLCATTGRLVINHLNFLAGTAHRKKTNAQQRKLVPTYVDEFASFACVEFADLISKARSAGIALHFSHQSVGDLMEVAPGFNSATKIVMRINDPESAEYFAKAFGTALYQKATYRVTNTKDGDSGDMVGEGTVREAHHFRASPDLMKSHATGAGSVFIAHGREAKAGATCVFRIQFPQFKEVTA